MSTLVEISGGRREGEPPRRWFTSDRLDLIVWSGADGSVLAFQLCYDKPHRERAVTWRSERWAHFEVDAGDENPGKNPSPILVAGGAIANDELIAEFVAAARDLDATLKDFVVERLRAM